VEDTGSLLVRVDAVRRDEKGVSAFVDEVCLERTYTLSFNGAAVGALVASPGMLRELGAGFAISEGLARSVEDVEVDGSRIMVRGTAVEAPGAGVTGTSGGLSTGRIVGAVASRVRIDVEDIARVMASIVSPLWERTGGAHCSVLYKDGEVVAKSSDVGRHNTVDKVIGSGVLAGVDLSGCVLGCTGRQPAGMVVKAVNAGIPVIVSKAATTDEGVRLARAHGVTLVCRAKDGAFNVYAHPERIRGLGASRG